MLVVVHAMCCISMHACTVSLSNFTYNEASMAGAGVYVSDSATLNCSRSSLARNTEMLGAGVAVWSKATARLYNVQVKHNIAKTWGGGLSVGGTAHVVFWDATFYNNTSEGGCGGICAYEQSSTRVTHALFWNNSATGALSGGGAIGVWGDAVMRVTDANILRNTAAFAGGIVVKENGTLRLQSSSLTCNTGAQSGGALHLAGNCSAWVTLCDVEDNTARERDGGAIFQQRPGQHDYHQLNVEPQPCLQGRWNLLLQQLTLPCSASSVSQPCYAARWGCVCWG